MTYSGRTQSFYEKVKHISVKGSRSQVLCDREEMSPTNALADTRLNCCQCRSANMQEHPVQRAGSLNVTRPQTMKMATTT